MKSKWIDVTTTAIPRLCTKPCITSFRKSMNAGQYRLRWIFHLDRYPGLEQYFEENKKQAEEIADMFDDFILLEAEEHQGFSGSLHEVWSKTTNHVLHIEDDWLWLWPWKLQDVLDTALDGYCFNHRRARAGATSPTLWKRHMMDSVLAAWPKRRPINENWLRIFCYYRMRYRNAGEWAGGVCRPCRDVGRRVMKHLGFRENAESLNLAGYRTMSPELLQQRSEEVWTERSLVPGRSPMVSRMGQPVNLENTYLNGSLFMVLSGPSVNKLDLTKLQQRGIVTMAVNNAGCLVRPNIWTFGDSTCKFHEALFRDPAILKILPKPRMSDRIRTQKDGQFHQTDTQVVTLPGVVCIERNCVFNPETWLYENSINWGNGKEGQEVNKYPRVLSTMIQAVRLAYYLGFRKVFLLGCDFRMESGQAYAFDQYKSEGAINGNHNSYLSIEWIFSKLKPYFAEAGFQVFNCNPESHMGVFPYLSYDDALKMALKDFPTEITTYGWYDSRDGSKQDENPMRED